jgi:PPOX class probable F420-dependent enzyme
MRLTRLEAQRRFGSARVARLATVTPEGRPHVVPVTFAVNGELIYTAVDAKPKSTTDLRRLRNIRANPYVAVLADHYADDWKQLWWVRADGRAAIIEEPDAAAAPMALLAARYPQYREDPPSGPLITISVTAWIGWSAR